jgi:hypothetical protein
MSLIGWWKLDGDANDSSQSFNNGIETGISYSDTLTKVGKSATFTGDGRVGDSGGTHIDFTNYSITTHHSVAFWMYCGTQSPGSATDGMLLGTFNEVTDYMYAADALRFRVNPGTSIDWTSDTDFYQRWRHVALLFESSTITLYLDGVSQGAGSAAYDGTYNINDMGACHNSEGLDFNGQLSDVRIYDHILSKKEIDELANAKVLHWQFSHERNNNGDAILDSSGYGRHTVLDANSPTWSDDTAKGVGCYDISLGSNAYIEIDTTDFPVVFEDQVTVSLWANWDTFSSWQTLIHGSITNSWTSSYWLASNSASLMRWSINGDNTHDFNPGLVAGIWHHICAIYDGSNCNVYINGIEKAGNFARSGVINNQNGVKIGLDGVETPYDFGGRIADVRVYNRALTGPEAIALYQTAAQLDNKGNLWC